MSKVQRKIQFARDRGVYVFRWPAFYERAKRGIFTYRLRKFGESFGEWAVYSDGEWSPRVGFSKREAANLAYAIAIARKYRFKVTIY